MVAYIYLVQMADGVHKAGRTEQDFGLDLKRFKSYPRDATVLFIRTCSELDVQRYETKILKNFRTKFGKHPRGSEYFQGDERYMIRTINDIMNSDPQAEFFETLEKGPEFWIPFVFLQAHFDTFCRVHGYAKRFLDVDTVCETRDGLVDCDIVEGVRVRPKSP